MSKAISQPDHVRKKFSRIDLAEYESNACFAKSPIKWDLLELIKEGKSLQSKGGRARFSKPDKIFNNDLSNSNGLDGFRK